MKIAIIGCGGLGSSLAQGLLGSSNQDIQLRLCDKDRSKMDFIVKRFSERETFATHSPAEAAEGAEIVVIAVKPKDVDDAVTQLSQTLGADALLVSCASGIEIEALKAALGKKAAVARAMPNIAVSVSAGTTGLFFGPNCEIQRDEGRLERIFGTLGTVKSVANEYDLHAVTALSGSGPAFVLVMLEAMIEAGVKCGLARSEAEFFAKGAFRAASALVENSAISPSDVRAKITSPAGTTAEGLYQLEKGGFRAAVMDAIESACCRSEELAVSSYN